MKTKQKKQGYPADLESADVSAANFFRVWGMDHRDIEVTPFCKSYANQPWSIFAIQNKPKG